MTEHIDELESKSLTKICAMMNPYYDYYFPASLVDKAIEFQQLIASRCDDYDIKSLLQETITEIFM